MIFGSKESRYWDIRKIFALLALVAAIVAARGAGNYLAYAGVSYYLICIIAILLRFRRAGCLLWFAVGVHVLLTGWSLWSWHTELIIPCHYCLWAAGFVLLAATAFYRLPAAVLPVLLMVGVSAAWPYAFGDKVLDEINPPAGEATFEPVSAPGDNQSGEEDDTLPAGETPAMGLPAESENSGAANPAPTRTSPAAKPAPAVSQPEQPEQPEPGKPAQNGATVQPAGAGSEPSPEHPEQPEQGGSPDQQVNQPDPGAEEPDDRPQDPEDGDPVGGVEEPAGEPEDNQEDEPKKPKSG